MNSDHKNLLSWKAAAGGLLVALMTFIILTSLGAGLAGFTAESLIRRENGGLGLLTGAGLFMGISILISLFCGSYFALRISRFFTAKIGSAHGMVIASAFFLLMLFGLGNAIGGMASGFGSLARAAGDGAGGIAGNPIVQDSINQAIGTAQLKSDPSAVAQGLTARLLQGDTQSAKNYLAYQTGMPSGEIEVKIAQLKTQFDIAVRNAGVQTARAVGNTGVTFFILFLIGILSATFGGRMGAHANAKMPYVLRDSMPNLAPLAT